MTKNKRAVLYLRVSTIDKNQDPENQKNPLLDFAKGLGYEVVGEYVDYASGGSANRPQFQKMMKDAQQHKFDIVLVWALDRFSREGIRSTVKYLDTLKLNNVALKSFQEGWLDTSDEGVGELILYIFSWVAEQERKRLSERTKAGMAKAKANGKPIGKRGKDKNGRKKSGYYLRWEKARKIKEQG